MYQLWKRNGVTDSLIIVATVTKIIKLQWNFKTERRLSNGKINSSITSNNYNTTVSYFWRCALCRMTSSELFDFYLHESVHCRVIIRWSDEYLSKLTDRNTQNDIKQWNRIAYKTSVISPVIGTSLIARPHKMIWSNKVQLLTRLLWLAHLWSLVRAVATVILRITQEVSSYTQLSVAFIKMFTATSFNIRYVL